MEVKPVKMNSFHSVGVAAILLAVVSAAALRGYQVGTDHAAQTEEKIVNDVREFWKAVLAGDEEKANRYITKMPLSVLRRCKGAEPTPAEDAGQAENTPG